MKSLLIPSSFPCKETPNATVFVRDHARVVQSFSEVVVCNTIVIVGGRNEVKKIKYTEYGYIVDCWVYSINNVLKLLWIHKLFPTLIFSIIHASKCIKVFKPDLIIAHQIRWASLVALVMKKLHSLPFVTVNHSSTSNIFRKFIYKQLFHFIIFQSAMNIYVSKPQFEKFKEIDKSNKIIFLGNPVDTNYFMPKIRKTILNNHSEIKILFIGSPSLRKGLDVLFQSIGQIINHINNKIKITCLVRDVNDYWVEKIRNSAIAAMFNFVGFTDKEKLLEILLESDFLAAPSRDESFSYAVAESISCGKPVVVTSCGGPEWYVTKEVGIVCEPNDVDSFSKGLSYMIHNYHKYNPWLLHDHIEKNFSFETIAKKMKSILSEIENSKMNSPLDKFN